jgi:serine/threonine protein kinase
MAMEVVNTKHPRISTAYYSEDLADLIDKLLEKDPNNRPSARDLLKMEMI